MTHDLARLSLNTATTKRWSLEQAVRGAERAGVPLLGLWRDRVAEVGTARAARLVQAAGLGVTSLCRGGFLTAPGEEGRAAALTDNTSALEEAAELGAPELVLVVGGLPASDRDLAGARARVADRVAELVPVAQQHGVRLALEPLHPMHAGDRAVLSTLEQALDLAAPHPAAAVGVVVDAYHVWWDPHLAELVARAGREGRLALYQVCDFVYPIAADALLSRGLPGDGVVDVPALTALVAATGYAGAVEVEVFSAAVWDRDGDAVLADVVDRHRRLVLPALHHSPPR